MITANYSLENEMGAILALTPGPDADMWLKNTEGLGTASANTYSDLDSGFFTYAKNTYPQETITTDVQFIKNSYENYRSLIDFMQAAKSLYFVYCPYGDTKYRRKVKLSSITKGLRDGSGCMVGTMELVCLTPWYNAIPVKAQFSDQTTDAWRYGISCYDAGYYAAGYSQGFSVGAKSGGHMDAAFKLTYTGAAYHPTITLTSIATGTEYGKVSIQSDIPGNSGFILDTNYGDCSLKTLSGDNLLQYIDLTHNPFFRIPADDCELKIESEASLSGTANIEIYNYFRSV